MSRGTVSHQWAGLQEVLVIPQPESSEPKKNLVFPGGTLEDGLEIIQLIASEILI